MKWIIEEKFDPLVWWLTLGLQGIFKTKRNLVVFATYHVVLLTETKLYKSLRQKLCTQALPNHKNHCQPLSTRSDRGKTQSTVLPHVGTRTGTCWLRGCCADGQASCTSCLSTWTTSSTHYSGRRWDLLLTFNSLQYEWVNYDFLYFSVNIYCHVVPVLLSSKKVAYCTCPCTLNTFLSLA